MAKRGSGVLRSRKGMEFMEDFLLWIFYVIIAAAIGLAFFSMVNQIASKGGFEKSYLSRDLAYVANAVYYAPGDVKFSYRQQGIELERFAFSFDDGVVSVAGMSHEDGLTPIKYYYHRDFMIRLLADDIASPYSVKLGKIGSTVYLGSRQDIKRLDDCLRLNTSDRVWREKEVFIDPGHGSSPSGSSDTGLKSAAGLAEEDITTSIASNINILKKSSNLRFTRQIDSDYRYMAMEDRLKATDQGNGLLVSLHAGHDSDAKKTSVTAYFMPGTEHSAESRKFACLLAGNIYSAAEGYAGFNVMPYSPQFERESSSFRILMAGMPAVYLELGNIDYSGAPDPLKDSQNRIAEAIWKSIEEYYK